MNPTRRIAELTAALDAQGIVVHLKLEGDGVLVTGPTLADVPLAKSELRKLNITLTEQEAV